MTGKTQSAVSVAMKTGGGRGGGEMTNWTFVKARVTEIIAEQARRKSMELYTNQLPSTYRRYCKYIVAILVIL